MGANQRVPQGQEIAMVHILDLKSQMNSIQCNAMKQKREHEEKTLNKHLHNYISKCISEITSAINPSDASETMAQLE